MKKKQIITGMLSLAAAVAATSARASVVTQGNITFSIDQVANNVGSLAQKYDIWDITVTNLTGIDAQSGSNGAGISSIPSGTFAVTGTGSATNSLLTPGKTATVAPNTTTAGNPSPSAADGATNGFYDGGTYLDMDSVIGFARNGLASSGTTYNKSLWTSSMSANWFIDPTGASPFIGPDTFTSKGGLQDNPFFSEIIVTHGSNWTFNGSVLTGHDNQTTLALTNVPTGTPASISLTSAASKTPAGTAGVAGSNGSYHVTSIDTISPGVASGSVSISDIGNEVGTFIAGINVTGDVNAIASALNGSNGITVTAVNGAILGMPGTWNLEATIANPTGAGANDFLNIDLGTLGTVTSVAAIPEPGTLGLAGLGAVLAAARRKRRA